MEFNSMFDESKEVKYFKEIEGLQVKSGAYLEPKPASLMKLFCDG